MLQYLNKLFFNKTTAFMFGIILLLIIPDIVFSLINNNFKLSHDIKVLLLLIPLAIGMLTSKYKTVSVIVTSIIFIVQSMQFSCISYFGSFLTPYSIYLFTTEMHDTFLEASNVFFKYAYIIPMLLLPYVGILFLINKSTVKSKIGTFILICTFCSFGSQYFTSNRARIMPNGLRFTINNSLKAFWGYFIIKYDADKIVNYLPYKIIDKSNDKHLKKFIDSTNNNEPINIIYIIGESANYTHMSLFGYARNTTPELKKLSFAKNVYFTQGISGAISTVAATKFATSILREANNPTHASQVTNSIFKLAKQKGFKTFYLSNQTEHLVSSISGSNYIDVIKTKDSNPIKSEILMDDNLIEMLKEQTFNNKNFIILHQRCIHSPYKKTFSKNFKIRNTFSGSNNPIIDEYDNAMIYNDYIVAKIFNFFNNQKNGKYYIIWASDHNELLGEDNMWGHGQGYLLPKTADIPIIIQSNDDDYLKKMKSFFKLNHYEIIESIANILGYEIQNPNAKDNVFHISGIDFNGKCGYIEYEKNSKTKQIKYIIKNE